MRKSRYTEEQISCALRQAETGTPAAGVIRRMGLSEQTFYQWKKLYVGFGVGELRRLKLLEDENGKFKRLVAARSPHALICRNRSFTAVDTTELEAEN